MIKILNFFFFIVSTFSISQEIAVLKYRGGGDWYANTTALPNLINFCNNNINTTINENPKTVTATSIDIFEYPFIHMTGHGNVYFSLEDAENLRNYMYSGGFLHIDDNYGMDKYIKKELKKVFPNQVIKEIPSNHQIFSNAFNFPNGLPKIHEHDGKPPRAYGYFYNDKLICLYTTESDLGDGWENKEIHNDSQEIRLKALQMGANIIKYAFEN
jgi:hypothetical protein